MSRNGFIARRTANSASGGDSIGTGRAQNFLPVGKRDMALLSDVHAADVYLSGTRKMFVKWHDGLVIREARWYRGFWTVRIEPLSGAEACWVSAVDVELRARKEHRVRGIGTHYMAFVHKSRTEAEVTIDRYLHAIGRAA